MIEYEFHCSSEAGGHPINEDFFESRPHPVERSCRLYALADGQGGRPGGLEAARLACASALDRLVALPVRTLMKPSTWLDALRRADATVADDPRAGFTTLACFAVYDDRLIGASSGDCAVWLTNARGLVRELTDRQRANPPVGSGGARPEAFASELKYDWSVVAMSDGVWKSVGRDRVRTLLGTARGPALLDVLKNEARSPGDGSFSDDCTIVVIREGAPGASGS